MNRIRLSLGCLTSALLVGAAPALGQVEGRIARAGLFAGADPIVRGGNWTFVEVELRQGGPDPFEGELHVEQRDRDGDIATSVMQVALAPGTEWRPYRVYFVPYEAASGPAVQVTLFNAEGEQIKIQDDTGRLVSHLLAPTTSELSPEDLLIVDLTNPRRLPHVALLDVENRREHNRVNARKVRSLSPAELPAQWHGLDAVDVVVWDDADPSSLSQQQVDALVHWVEAGGRLLITSGKNWQALAASPLAEALPVDIRGVDQRTEAQEFLDLVENDAYEGFLDRHFLKHPITRCRLRPRPGALALPADCPNPQICYRRMLGRGFLVFVGAPLAQLLPAPKRYTSTTNDDPGNAEAPAENDPFLSVACERVVARKLLALPPVLERGDSMQMLDPTDLFQVLRSSVGFESVGAKFLVFAVLFAIVYTLVATGGSYWYLRRRGWLHHCWTAFGVVSVLGSVVGIIMVGALRGVTTKLWQTTIVDAHAGVDHGHAACLFGVKTPNHTRLDVRLPVGEDGNGESGPVEVMPGSSSWDSADTRFVAAAQYNSVSAGMGLNDVPVRATLKEFMGSWHGRLGGALEGRLILRRVKDTNDPLPWEFAEGSYLRNNLGVALHDCYLLESSEEVAGASPISLASCFFLGDLPAEGPDSQLDNATLRQRLMYQTAPGAAPEDPPERIKRLPLLDASLKNWTSQLRSLIPLGGNLSQSRARLTGREAYTAALLLSTFGLMREGVDGFRRSHGRVLDCIHGLGKQTAILIGYADETPPAILEVDRDPLRPNKSLTIYRVVIPVTRQSAADSPR